MAKPEFEPALPSYLSLAIDLAWSVIISLLLIFEGKDHEKEEMM